MDIDLTLYEPAQARGLGGLAAYVCRLERAQRLAGVGSWEWEPRTGSVTWSPELYRILDVGQATPVTYASLLDRLHPDDRPWVEDALAAAVATGQSFAHEARIVRADGQVRWIAVHGEIITDVAAPVRLSGSVQDITDRKLAEVELARRAITDSLTALPTRTLFTDRLEHALAAGRRTGAPLSLLMVDLDGFKPVNDVYGHAAGDAVLVEVAARLRTCTRPGDTLARIGGDEFAIVLPSAGRNDAAAVARRTIERISAPVALAGAGDVAVGASVGIAVSQGSPHGGGDLLREADLALYAAKRGGRGQHVVFHSGVHDDARDRLLVDVGDARAWAVYTQALRAEIAVRMDAGALPKVTRAPESIRRTLQTLLAAIEHLPGDGGAALLGLPHRTMLEEFVSHHTMVHHWADHLVRRGTLTTRRRLSACRFWSHLQQAVAT